MGTQMSAPSQELAKIIIERLVDEKLMIEEDAKKIEGKLSEGKLKAEDWRMVIEKAIQNGAK